MSTLFSNRAGRQQEEHERFVALRALVAELIDGTGPLGIVEVAVGVTPPYSEAPRFKCKGCGEYGHSADTIEHRDWCYRERARKALEGGT